MTRAAVPLPPALAHALAEVFGAEALHQVDIHERVWWLRPMPWVAAITGPGRIWLRGSAEDFFADPGLVLHEYCHVLRQWAPGRLSAWRYVVEWLRAGYRRNRFEVEARAFAAAELPRVCQHDFIALPYGQLEHRMDGHVRATVPPEGLKAYADTWPDCAPL